MDKWARMPIGSTPRRGQGPLGLACTCLLACVPLLAAVPASLAQGARLDDMPRRAAASRQELASLATRAESAAATTGISADRSAALQRYASELRARMRTGDFQAGDNIVLSVRGDTTLSGTHTVQPSRTLVVASLPPIPLTGVLRSELQPYLANRLRAFVRDTLLRGTPLVRLGVLGEVAHPGYYRVSLDQTLSDALMAAGGPTAQADLRRTTMRRGDATVLTASAVREAMIREQPLNDLDVDSGDELVVVPPRQRNWSLIAQLAGLATGIVLTVQSLRR
jgi:protein involved in polysaccharide export with SLBB domain